MVFGLLLPCYSPAPFILLLCSYSSLAAASALPLRYSCPAHFKLLSGTFLAPPQFLPSSCPLSALFCFTLLSSAPALFLPCSCPAHASAPLLLCSSPAPALLLPCSWSCSPQFGSLHHHQYFITFFGTAITMGKLNSGHFMFCATVFFRRDEILKSI